MNAKNIIIISVISFISGCILTAAGLYISEKSRLEQYKNKIVGIENINIRLQQENIELSRDTDDLRKQLNATRENNKRLASEIELLKNGAIKSTAIIDEIQTIVDRY